MEHVRIRIGSSGLNYPSGPGAWKGTLYPATHRTARFATLDKLYSYADHVDMIKINSTFYRIPPLRVTCHWVVQTPTSLLK